MKLLLTTLNSKYVHSNLALRYLYAVAKKWISGEGACRELQVDIAEFTINNPSDYVFGEWIRGGYDVICLSCYIWNIRQLCDLAQSLKLASPRTKIVLGGPEVSFETRQFLREHPWADFVLMGEGEGVFFQWLTQLTSKTPDFSSVRGLAWRTPSFKTEKDDGIQINSFAPVLLMEEIPFPYEALPAEDDKVLYYESSRGCPFHCAYCLSSLEKEIRALPLSRVTKELDYFLQKQVKQVKFIDRTFNYDKERSLKIFRYLIEKDNGVTNFHFEICADLVDEETIRLLSKARKGLFQFEIGVQSTNPRVLEICGRNDDLGRLTQAVKRLKGLNNIHLHLDLICGLPGESLDSVRQSFNDVYGWEPDALQMGFLKVLKGTPMAAMARKYGIVWRPWAPYEALCTDAVTTEEMVLLKMIEEVLELYWNRGGFRKTMEYTVRYCEETAFDCYRRLAEFYYGEGYQHRSHKKEDLYRILYRFFEKTYKKRAEEARQLLRQDMAATLNPEAVKKFERKGWELSR